MPYLKPLNTRRVKEIQDRVQEHFGTMLPEDAIWYYHTKQNDVYILTNAAKEVDFESLRVNNCGLYVANMDREIRLSIEGSQLIGPDATKNVVDLSYEEMRSWLRGEDIPVEHADAFVLVRCGTDYCGCGKVKAGTLLNYVPKGRRVQSKD